MAKPYIVSGDIVPLLAEWAGQGGFILPGGEFFQVIRAEFAGYMEQIFPSFEFVHEVELTTGINDLIFESGLTPVSLERVYSQSVVQIDIARHVDNVGNDRGLAHRPGTPHLIQQFRKLNEMGLKEIILVDDVIFTGELIERIIRCLSYMGIRVPLVCAGIGIVKGINHINESGQEVRCVRQYNEVIDEVCERDFYPGVPLSGRLLVGGENVGVPYLLPFGNPGKWASIPEEWQPPFSKFCIRQTVRLFEEIERCSNRQVNYLELGRWIATLPQDGVRFVDALRNCYPLAD